MGTKPCVAILGAGSWGTALAIVARECSEVRLWARSPELVANLRTHRINNRYLPGCSIPEHVNVTGDLTEALKGADVVVFAVPSAGMSEVAAAAAPLIEPNALLVNAAKGLDETTGRRMSEVIADAMGGRSYGHSVVAISGPNLALEVARGLPTATVAASYSETAARMCQQLWMGPTLRVYSSRDIVGVELAGAMKNVIAIGAGVCEGMGYGDNSRAALMTRGLAEITRLGVALGADARTFLGLAGVGDLIATGGSRLSRNYRVGLGLGQGKDLNSILKELGQVAEGVPTTRAICTLAAQVGIEMPVSRAIYDLLFEGAPVADTIRALMLRPPKEESI